MKTWYRLRAARQTAELFLYDEIGGWGINSKDLITQLDDLGTITALTVRINSPGGDVFDALAIHNALNRHPARVTVCIDALCASAATLVALAADEVRMADNAMFMIHEPWTVAMGNSADLLKQSDLLDTVAEQIVNIYARKTGAEPTEVRDWMRTETWYTAEQALAAGFIDAIDEPLKLAALIRHPLTAFKHPPETPMALDAVTPETIAVPETPDAPDVPETPPAPVALDPVIVSQLCLTANEPALIPHLLKAGIKTEGGVRNALASAQAVRKICAIAKTPELADGLIASGASPDQAKLITWNTLAARDEAAPVDPTPPLSSARAATRAQFDALTPAQRRDHLAAGGRVSD